jgi:hypothetical protein
VGFVKKHPVLRYWTTVVFPRAIGKIAEIFELPRHFVIFGFAIVGIIALAIFGWTLKA